MAMQRLTNQTRNYCENQQCTRRRPTSAQITLLVLIVLLGFLFRIRGLGRVGFNEDEINKVEAARAYLHGDIKLNREHPMLMKSMISLSLTITDRWNRGFGPAHQIREEVAVRLPNVIFGSLTAVVIFTLAHELIGIEVALFAAFFWSVGTIPIIVNRLAKEDTLLVFFTWLGFYFYYRAKSASKIDPDRGWPWYAAAGASFGLMLASKYFPHYLGILFLFWFLPSLRKKYPGFHRREYLAIFGTCCLVFVLANPVILLPSTLRYMLFYVKQGTVTHHGYLMMGQFFYNDPAHFMHGMPVYFYALLLAVKTQIPILIAMIVGLTEVYRRRRESNYLFFLFMFLIWLVPFSLVSAKWLRWMLSWMPSVCVIAGIGAMRILIWTRAAFSVEPWPVLKPLSAAGACLFLLVSPAITTAKAGPFYSLYLNSFGLGHRGFYFPHDEWADVGLRPSIQRICQTAPPGAIISGEAPPVFTYYLRKFGRTDLRYIELSGVATMTSPRPAYLVVEDGRKYVDNIAFISAIEVHNKPMWTIEVGRFTAARIYREADWPHESPSTLSSQPVATKDESHRLLPEKIASTILASRQSRFSANESATPARSTIKIQLED